MDKIKRKTAKWFDEWGLALKGALLASKSKSFWLPALITFIVFGILLNLLAGGLGSFKLISVSGLNGAFKIIWSALLGIFGVNKNFLDWFLNFFISFLQGVLVGLVVFVYKKNKTNAKKNSSPETNSNFSNTGIVAGLAMLGAGCPTCGTTLLAPILGMIFSTSGFALANTISGVLTFLAILVALLVLKKVGFESYAIIKSENYEKRKKEAK